MFQPVLDDFELQFAHGPHDFAVAQGPHEQLGYALIRQLLDALFQLLALHRILVDQFFEDFRRKTRNATEHHVFSFGQCVPNFEGAGVVQPHHIARPRFVYHIFVLGEEGRRVGKLHFFVQACVLVKGVALEFAAADAHEGDAVPVPRIDVGVDFENESCEARFGGQHLTDVGRARPRVRGDVDEGVEHLLDAEVVDRASKEHRGQLSFEVGSGIPWFVYTLDEFNVVSKLIRVFGRYQVIEVRVGDVRNGDDFFGDFGFVRVEKAQLFLVQAVHTSKRMSPGNGPTQRPHLDLQFFFQFVQEVERILSLQIHLVDEDDDRCVAHAADFHESLGLRLYAFDTVHHQNDAVHRGQCAVGIFCEVFVSGGVQQVDQAVPVVKSHDRCGHRNATLALDFHEIRSRCFRDFVVLHRTGRLNCPAKEEEFFSQRGLARIRVADDGERSSPLDFFLNCAHGGANLRCRNPKCSQPSRPLL